MANTIVNVHSNVKGETQMVRFYKYSNLFPSQLISEFVENIGAEYITSQVSTIMGYICWVCIWRYYNFSTYVS